MVAQLDQLTFSFPHKPDFDEENFIVSPCNQQAFDYLKSWPHWPEHFLAISGPYGSGKSHLAHLWAKHSGAKILTLQQLLQKTPDTLGKNPLVIDIDQTIMQENQSLSELQEAHLFHVYNWMKEERQNILWVARLAPAKWSIKLPDLQSRLKIIPHIEIQPADDMLLSALYVKLFSDRQLQVTPKIIDELLLKGPRSYQEAQKLVEELDHTSLKFKKIISLKMIRDLLN